MSDTENKVECEIHGSCNETFVCQHLLKGENLGFNYGYDPEIPDNLYPDAWCNECEKVREAEGEWNDTSESFADIKLLCSSCYENSREKNWVQDNEKYHDFICHSFKWLEEKQNIFMEEFQINDHERYDWDQDTGKLIFSHEGKPQVETDISFVGSFSTKSDTWMWAWANSSFEEVVKSKSRCVREIGEQLGFMKFAAPHWPATIEDGWEMTAVMAKSLDAVGSYRTPSDTGYLHMIISKAKWLSK